jgi:hypothetical protein
MRKIIHFLPSENLVQILPESGSALDPHSSKMMDPYPHIINVDPKTATTS